MSWVAVGGPGRGPYLCRTAFLRGAAAFHSAPRQALFALMPNTISTDICIIEAGQVGLFAVFEAGLLKLRCHVVDALPQPGGQLSEIYPKKPIYDIPGFPEILAGDLVDNLMKQIAPFHPTFTLGERVERFAKLDDGSFQLYTTDGTERYVRELLATTGRSNHFSDMRRRLLITATDLDTAERKVFGEDEGDPVPISEAAAASTAR